MVTLWFTPQIYESVSFVTNKLPMLFVAVIQFVSKSGVPRAWCMLRQVDKWWEGGRMEGSQVDQGSMHTAAHYWYNLMSCWETYDN